MAAPVSLEEFKQRIGVEHDRRDDFFLSVIDGVSAAAEAYIGRSSWPPIMSGGTTATAKTASCWTIIPSCRCRPSKSTARMPAAGSLTTGC